MIEYKINSMLTYCQKYRNLPLVLAHALNNLMIHLIPYLKKIPFYDGLTTNSLNKLFLLLYNYGKLNESLTVESSVLRLTFVTF